MNEAQTPADRLENFPITFYAIVMGMLGLTLAIHAAETAFSLPSFVSPVVLVVSVGILASITALYALKYMKHRKAVVAEWAHPVKIAFFPTASISILLLSVAVLPYSLRWADTLWIMGAALQAALTLSVIANWIGHRSYQQVHLGPAWFIPAVGNAVAPITGAMLGYTELSWLFFSAGLIFWIVLLTLVMNRLIFHDPLPARLMPTLVILIAPPAVAFIAYYRLTGEVDAFARILLNTGYVFAAVVVTQIGKFRRLPFALSWWALSFPVAALTIASFLYAERVGTSAHEFVAGFLLTALVLIIAGLLIKTLQAIAARKICEPE
ncbi:SLAC1 anion channel family protein [Oricola thermophila]|uniref:C4-dicarboxylate ABC transporter n=1 Tax=Oricola thermophila TaxID=2742145 RepID=A0A6N1VBX8_9HYPH|nr:SLAC1 anion channel family protein [Oricola thermophila]QKV17015.1 C4-dicarboxylate ABC transporter [Oricola thermophila]